MSHLELPNHSPAPRPSQLRIVWKLLMSRVLQGGFVMFRLQHAWVIEYWIVFFVDSSIKTKIKIFEGSWGTLFVLLKAING
jgi:hypothetical protein